MGTKTVVRALAAAALLAGCRAVPDFDSASRGRLAESVVSRWSEAPRRAAKKMIDLYGPPDALADDGLGWSKRGPWKRIVVRNSDEILRQTVAYRVPGSKRAALARLTGGVRASEDGDELSARSSDERTNILALNLADEVVRGGRSDADARRFYERVVLLDAAGKSSVYLQRLMFATGD